MPARPWFVLLVVLAWFAPGIASADIVTLVSVQDNSIFENVPNNANGSGPGVHAGKSGTTNNAARRGLFQFDLTTIPDDAIIDRVTLSLRLADVPAQEIPGAERDYALHRLLASWGEGSSFANFSGGTGNGAAAGIGDATWLNRFFDPTTPVAWVNPGGDFSVTSSLVAPVGTDLGTRYLWDSVRGTGSEGLVLDVEAWLGDPSSNQGWILKIVDESINSTVRRFNSREAGIVLGEDLRPLLTIEFTPVPEPSTLALVALTGILTLWRRKL